ncbi:hypothetical protein LMK08_00130 [Metapseudomonas furukawaii]|uniref:Nmad3 family putative nucleotide modification protein n=1 Tax=Metapseudomonas furukawaii TaxID=1149133 RepID=UPI00227D38EE|nr:hypothetical protein [Pseudomonas furukawaii]WAG79112.1 hypothetical protein LMK08_00130 [Pseudomonas furukawaii]
MRIILSRKGFDSASGGCPSPIFPDGRLLSLPIPDKTSPIAYRDIRFANLDVGELVAQLSDEPRRATHFAHLDPDLRPEALPRQAGWCPLLGQTGSAQGHLRNQGVQPGDIFLFFGLFRAVARNHQGWCFKAGEAACHLIWGWMQIAEIVKVDSLPSESLPWARYHPHFACGRDPANTLYLAAEQLSLKDTPSGYPGAGVFQQFDERLRLTAPQAALPSLWRLPNWFYPQPGRPCMSYHTDPTRWSLDGTDCRLQSAARGQEFVLDIAATPEALPWLTAMLAT